MFNFSDIRIENSFPTPSSVSRTSLRKVDENKKKEKKKAEKKTGLVFDNQIGISFFFLYWSLFGHYTILILVTFQLFST